MPKLFVTLDLYRSRNKSFEEKRVVLGPYVRVAIADSVIVGFLEDGSTEELFEATVGQGGYCDTCAYNYPDFTRVVGSVEYKVTNWEIEAKDA